MLIKLARRSFIIVNYPKSSYFSSIDVTFPFNETVNKLTCRDI